MTLFQADFTLIGMVFKACRRGSAFVCACRVWLVGRNGNGRCMRMTFTKTDIIQTGDNV